MKKVSSIVVSVLLVFSLVIIPACGGNPKNVIDDGQKTETENNNDNTENDNKDVKASNVTRYVVKPVQNNYRLDYSYTDGNFDYWYLYLGEIDFVPISSQSTQYYGGQSPISMSYTTTYVTSEGISETSSLCIANTTAITNTYNNTIKIESATEFGSLIVKEKITVGYSHEWGGSDSVSDTTSKTDTYETFKNWSKSTSETITYSLGGNGENSGFYRVTLFCTSDVFVAIAYDKATDEYYYQYSTFARPNTLFTAIDYNETSDFTKREGNKLVFDTNLLGNLPMPDSNYPIEELFESKISVGSSHILTIDTNGNLWAWGNNGRGSLGDGTTINRTSPIQIKSGTKFSQVSAGSYHSLAIDTNGNLWAWGSNDNGRLGDGTTTRRNSPIIIKSGTKFSQISAGDGHSLAIDVSGNLWAWGYNQYGQVGVGDGFLTDRYFPIQIKAGTKFSQINAGNYYSLAIDINGNLWAWGQNGNGQLGDGTTSRRTLPVPIRAGTSFSQISAGWYYSSAIDTNGNLWTWGSNAYGQLGDGTTAQKTSPIQIKSGTKFIQVGAGAHHSLAIDTNGNAWVWGDNEKGQLGDGSYTSKHAPIQIYLP